MLTTSVGFVNQILNNEDNIQITEVIVKGHPAKAINYPVVCGQVFRGDKVLLNTTAVHLSLGTGGYHYVMGRIDDKGSENEVTENPAACLMKLRYTPAQFASKGEEEREGPLRKALQELNGNELAGVPVLVGELHSMLPAACLCIREIIENPVRICYIMTDGASLPMALSRHVQHLEGLGLINGTITYGHAFGGKTECVTLYSALVAAICLWRADIIIITPGPGVVGTGTVLGFSGMEQVGILQAVQNLGGRSILIPRVSLHDPRDRHFGISHHTSTVLRFSRNTSLDIALEEHPILLNQWAERSPSNCHKLTIYPQMEDRIWHITASLYPEMITTMGRPYKQDPLFFRHVYYAAALSCHLLRRNKQV